MDPKTLPTNPQENQSMGAPNWEAPMISVYYCNVFRHAEVDIPICSLICYAFTCTRLLLPVNGWHKASDRNVLQRRRRAFVPWPDVFSAKVDLRFRLQTYRFRYVIQVNCKGMFIWINKVIKSHISFKGHLRLELLQIKALQTRAWWSSPRGMKWPPLK